jgi:hypothetical protein
LISASPVWSCASRELVKAGKGFDATIQFLITGAGKRVTSEF